MKKLTKHTANLINFSLILLLFAMFVAGTVTYTLHNPVDYYETTATSVRFNWTTVSTINTSLLSYLLITTPGNESNWEVNQSLTCTNNTVCNVTITGLAIGFYKWKVYTDENGTNTSSDTRWLEIRDSNNQTNITWGNTTTDVMWLNRDTGDLTITGMFTATSGIDAYVNWTALQNYPAACPDGSTITTLDDSITCTAFVRLNDDVVFNNINVTNNVIVSGNLDVTGNITALDVFVKTDCESYSQVIQSITNVSTYAMIDFETNVECNGIITDGQNFTLGAIGEYKVSVDLQADKTGGSTTTIESVLFLDEVQINGSARQRTVNSNSEIGFYAINWDVITTSINQVLSVGITGSTDAARLDMICILCERNVTAAISIDRIG